MILSTYKRISYNSTICLIKQISGYQTAQICIVLSFRVIGYHKNSVARSFQRTENLAKSESIERKTLRCAWKCLSLEISFSFGFSIVSHTTAHCPAISLGNFKRICESGEKRHCRLIVRSIICYRAFIAIHDYAPTIKLRLYEYRIAWVLLSKCHAHYYYIIYFYYSINVSSTVKERRRDRFFKRTLF